MNSQEQDRIKTLLREALPSRAEAVRQEGRSFHADRFASNTSQSLLFRGAFGSVIPIEVHTLFFHCRSCVSLAEKIFD